MIQVQLKLRLRPAQERLLERWLWRLTGVYNWTIRKIELDAAQGIYYTRFDLYRLLNGTTRKIFVPSDAIKGTVATAHEAWRRCFKGLSKRPRLKGRRNRLNSIAFADGSHCNFKGNRLNIPGLGYVRYHEQDIPAGHVGSARVIRRASGWYICLFVQAEPVPIPTIADGVVGIDPGFSSLLTLSTGEVIDHPHEWQAAAGRLAQAQRGRRVHLTARLRERIANRRKDRNHKLSRHLVAENALIVWSRDSSRGIQRSFGKSVESAGHHQLRTMLAYKSRTGNREFIEVGSRNSTRTCSSCLALTGPAKRAGLKVRHWSCVACGATHDRDCNAAINTLRAGLGASLKRSGDGPSGIANRSKTAKFNKDAAIIFSLALVSSPPRGERETG